MKNFLLTITTLFLLFSAATAQPQGVKTQVKKSGYRIVTTYWGIGGSVPIGGLKGIVPTGLSTKLGDIFYFSKSGIANGLLNIGLNATWLNIEANVPYAKLGDPGSIYSLAYTTNYGPIVTINPVGELYVDAYYQIGLGFRMFPGSGFYFNYTHPDLPHLRFNQNAGVHVRYKALFTNLGFNILSNNVAHSNVGPLPTFQFLIGVCSRIN